MDTNGNGVLAVIGVIFFFLFWLAIVVGSILLFVFWILMIIDVTRREFTKSDDKILWLLVVILAGQIGAIIYYFMVKRHPEKYTQA